jgi:hypothetical protein
MALPSIAFVLFATADEAPFHTVNLGFCLSAIQTPFQFVLVATSGEAPFHTVYLHSMVYLGVYLSVIQARCRSTRCTCTPWSGTRMAGR